MQLHGRERDAGDHARDDDAAEAPGAADEDDEHDEEELVPAEQRVDRRADPDEGARETAGDTGDEPDHHGDDEGPDAAHLGQLLVAGEGPDLEAVAGPLDEEVQQQGQEGDGQDGDEPE